jgi:hypothetical protein
MASKFYKALTKWFGASGYNSAGGEAPVEGGGGVGSPIGLLLTLTKSA